MTTAQKAKETDTKNAGRDDGKPTMNALSFEHADAVRCAVEKIKGVNAIINALVSSETVGHHIYSSQLFFAMDDVLYDSCKALDSFLSAAGW